MDGQTRANLSICCRNEPRVPGSWATEAGGDGVLSVREELSRDERGTAAVGFGALVPLAGGTQLRTVLPVIYTVAFPPCTLARAWDERGRVCVGRRPSRKQPAAPSGFPLSRLEFNKTKAGQAAGEMRSMLRACRLTRRLRHSTLELGCRCCVAALPTTASDARGFSQACLSEHFKFPS